MKSFHKPTKAKRREGEEEVQWIPQYVGHRGTIRGLDLKTRKNAEHKVCQPKKADGNVDGDGHLLVDRMKNHHETGEKQIYREVKERWSYLDCDVHSVASRAKEQK
jgi:hypothetical protein